MRNVAQLGSLLRLLQLFQNVGRNLFLLKGKLRPQKPQKKKELVPKSFTHCFFSFPPSFSNVPFQKKKQRKNDSHEFATVKGWILSPFYLSFPPPNYRGMGGLKGKWQMSSRNEGLKKKKPGNVYKSCYTPP